MIGLFKQFIKFGFVGALNTIISLTIYYLFIWIDDGYYIIGNVIGFIVSTLNAYLLNSKFVFSKKTKQNKARKFNEIFKTFLSYGISLGLSTLLLYLEISIGKISEETAPIINLMITIPLNFCLNKFWVYKKKENVMRENTVSDIVEKHEPLVSICIPTYNGALFIADAIDSVLNQTYTNWELIVSDDGSTDKTTDIVKSYNDKRIRIVENSGKHGLAGNFKNCVHQATGKYFKLLCQDDLMYKDCLKKEVFAFENNPSVTVVTGASNIIKPNGQVIMKRQKYKSDKIFDGKAFIKKTFSDARNYYSEPSITMFKTQDAVENNVYGDETVPFYFCVDWDAAVLLSYIGDVYYISEPVAAFRTSDESTSVKMNADKKKVLYQMQIYFFERHRKLGKIKFNEYDFIRFKIFVKLNMAARNIIYKLKLK